MIARIRQHDADDARLMSRPDKIAFIVIYFTLTAVGLATFKYFPSYMELFFLLPLTVSPMLLACWMVFRTPVDGLNEGAVHPVVPTPAPPIIVRRSGRRIRFDPAPRPSPPLRDRDFD